MARPKTEDLLAVAHIVRPHGVWGEVSAIVLAPPVLDPEELILRRLFARSKDGEVREMEGVAVRPHQDRWLIQLAGIESMDDAEALREVDLCLPRAELPPLPEGWYWEDDLQRCRVIDKTLGEIGIVKGLNVNFAQPQLELRRPNGAVVLIPWVKAFIIKVNLETHEIHTDLPNDFPGISASATQR